MKQSAKVFSVLICSAVLALSTGCAKLQSRDQMNKGIQSYKGNKYADAVKHFQEAVRLDPTNSNAQKYLATSYMIQWVPGADSPDNKKNYDMARQEFDTVLKNDSNESLPRAPRSTMVSNSAPSR